MWINLSVLSASTEEALTSFGAILRLTTTLCRQKGIRHLIGDANYGIGQSRSGDHHYKKKKLLITQ